MIYGCFGGGSHGCFNDFSLIDSIHKGYLGLNIFMHVIHTFMFECKAFVHLNVSSLASLHEKVRERNQMLVL